MKFCKSIVLAVLGIVLAVPSFAETPGLGPGLPNARYATDAYPGFDCE